MVCEMSSDVVKTMTTTITAVVDDSAAAMDDRYYDRRPQDTTLTDDTIQLIKDLFITNNAKKLEIIQRRMKIGEDMVVKPAVKHLLLTDKEVDNEFKDPFFQYVFTKKSILDERLQKLKAKRKAVPKGKKGKETLKSDVQINTIPKSFEDFLSIICELNGRLVEDQNSKIFFREETHNREIQFQSHDTYVNAFIPFVIREFWASVKDSAKGDNCYHPMNYQRIGDNDIVCTHIRDNGLNESKFRFGQIVVLKYTLDESSDESKLFFGFVKEVTTELIHKNDDKNDDIMRQMIENQAESGDNDFIVEKITIYCNPLADELSGISVMPLICVQKYLLEARICCELRDERFVGVFEQLRKPVFRLGLTGASVDLEDRKDLFDIQKDSIQKAYDVCCFTQMTDNSKFVAINGGPKTGKSECLRETVLQLIRKADFKAKKVLVVTHSSTEVEAMVELLKKNEIKVFHIDSKGLCLSHKKSDIKRVVRKMNKEMHLDNIPAKDESIDKLLKYYNDDITDADLSVKDKYVKECIHLRVVNKLVTESQVIIGSIGDMMNDELFNVVYNSNDENNIECALVDNAHLLTETEVLTLLYAGVRGFALYGDNVVNARSHERRESFFQRYIRLYNKNYRQNDNKEYSVFHFRDSIESLQRLSRNSNNRANRGDWRADRKNVNNRMAEYRGRSNYGSTFFEKNNKFNDIKPVVKNEIKNESKPFGNNYEHRGRGGRSRRSRGGHHYGGPNRPPHHFANYSTPPVANNVHNGADCGQNLMTDGVANQMPAFGSRYSYDGRPSHPNDLNYCDSYRYYSKSNGNS